MDKYCKVLIVEDEFIMRQGMKHMMDWEKEGFQIDKKKIQMAAVKTKPARRALSM